MTELVKHSPVEEVTPEIQNADSAPKKSAKKKAPVLSSADVKEAPAYQQPKLQEEQKDLTTYPVKTAPAQQEAVRDEKKYARDKDREKVKGLFRYHEVPGGMFSFVFKKHKGDAIERYDLVDGQTYELPRGVAMHLANNVWYPVHEYMKDESGKPHQAIGRKVKRTEFYPTDFLALHDLSGNSNSIVSVHYL